MLELETLAPEPSEYGLTRAQAAIEEEERKKRLGHPWFGWWWALTPFRRALVVSSVLGALVATGIVTTPHRVPAPQPLAMTDSTTPVTLESAALNAKTFGQVNAAAPVPMAADERAAIASSVPTLRSNAQI